MINQQPNPPHPTTLTIQQLSSQQQAASSANLLPSPGSFLTIGPSTPSTSSSAPGQTPSTPKIGGVYPQGTPSPLNTSQRPSQQLQQRLSPHQNPKLPPPAPAPSVPKEVTKAAEIRALDVAVKLALSGSSPSSTTNNGGSSPSTSTKDAFKSLYALTPPVWWLIFEKYPVERCAPLGAFPHFPLAHVWPEYLGGNMVFEIKLLPSEYSPLPNNSTATPTGPNGIVHNYFSSSSLGAFSNSTSTTSSVTSSSSSSSTASHNGIGGRSSPLTTPSKGVNRKRNNNSTSESGGSNGGSSSGSSPACFWFVKIVGSSGCYLRLRYIGLGLANNAGNSSSLNCNSSNSISSSTSNSSSNSNSNSQHDFWVNFRLRNLYPVGYAKSHGHRMRLPKEVEAANPGPGSLARVMGAVRTALCGGARKAPTDLHSLFTGALQPAWVKAGLRVEAADKTKSACYRPATVDQLIGDRIHVRYDGEGSATLTGNESDTAGLWSHLQGGLLRPVGWSQLVGAELYACEAYAARSAERAKNVLVGGHLKKGERRAEQWGALTREEKFDEKARFKEGKLGTFLEFF